MLYACLYRPPAADRSASGHLKHIAEAFSPRYETCGDDLVTIDISGLERLLGSPKTIAEELRRTAAAQGVFVHVATASTLTAARILARARPGITVVAPGDESSTLALLPLRVLNTQDIPIQTFEHWGIRTLGELAALDPADLSARLGHSGVLCHRLARGEDHRPLVPDAADERFDATLDLEWPIEGLEPLSFVLTRLLEPLSIRLERRDRGAARLHVALTLVTLIRASSAGEVIEHRRSLELPTPIRDVRTLRTLALLDLESHPPSAAIERVTVTIDPTPARILQHTLFSRAQPAPERISTLLARLGALMGQDRVGAPATVDSYRPGVFAVKPFSSDTLLSPQPPAPSPQPPASTPQPPASALRRCRQPVPARVIVDRSARPVRVTTDRRGFAGGSVVHCAGPWRTSGAWWNESGESGGSGRSGRSGGEKAFSYPTHPTHPTYPPSKWDRDEWDVALSDGAVYRIFKDHETEAWFIDAIVD
jgi:protein ImuB